jgi:hypothetical protein
VGQQRRAAAPHLPAEVEEVEVDLPGTVAKRPRPTDAALDPGERLEKRDGRALPPERDDRVPEVPLLRVPDRRRAVERGDPEDGSAAGKLRHRGLEVGAPVPDVRAEADVG